MRWGARQAGRAGLLVLSWAVVACGGGTGNDTSVVGAAGGGETPATGVGTTSTTWFVSLTWDVEDVIPTGDPLAFDVVLAGLPVEGGSPPCAVQVEASYFPISSDPAISVRVSTDGRDFDRSFPGCTLGTRVVRLQTTEPIPMDRRVRAEGTEASRHWYPRDDGSLARCELPSCDPATGQPPEPPGCNAALVDAVRAGDVPRRSGIDVRRCEGEWAIVEIDIGASACPATGEPQNNPCAGQNIDRGYYRLVDGAWRHVGYDESAGCGSIHEQVPEFPAALCEGLPSLR